MKYALVLAAGIALGVLAGEVKPSIGRTPLLDTSLAGCEGKDLHLWRGDIPPGAGTGSHTHPTQRFVYVLEGAVTFDVPGQPPRTFRAGEAYVEEPGLLHEFRNASATAPARALGFQIASKGQPLQY